MDNFLENLRSAVGTIQDAAREVADKEAPRIKEERAIRGTKFVFPTEERNIAAERSTRYDLPDVNAMLTIDIAENYDDLVNVIKQYEKAISPKDKLRVLDESRKKFKNTKGINTWFDSFRSYTAAADKGMYGITDEALKDIAEEQHQWTYDAYNKYFGEKNLV